MQTECPGCGQYLCCGADCEYCGLCDLCCQCSFDAGGYPMQPEELDGRTVFVPEDPDQRPFVWDFPC